MCGAYGKLCAFNLSSNCGAETKRAVVSLAHLVGTEPGNEHTRDLCM